MWRIRNSDGSTLVLRMPLRPNGIASLEHEIELLPLLASTPIIDLVEIPTVVDSGVDVAGRPWAIYRWLEGEDAWALRDRAAANSTEVAASAAALVKVISACRGLPVTTRRPGARGGPLAPLLERLEGWLRDPQWSASALVEVESIRRVAAACAEVVHEPIEPVLLHGDLIAPNLLLRDGALSAVIDWGGAGHGDPAQDLAPVWSMFDGRSRHVFREAMDVDEATWLRACAFELEHAVGGVLYYVPRRHTLGDVMQRTLDRILAAHSD